MRTVRTGRRASTTRAEPSSRKGRERLAQILAAARKVLIKKGYTQFSLRNIAAAARVHLSNLQYYFPTRDALIHGLMDDVMRSYESRYEERFLDLPPLPRERFIAVIEYLIEDIAAAETRRFFIQLWALLESSDSSEGGTLLNELYAAHIRNLAEHIGMLNPGLSPAERQQRAAMVASMIDGMMLMLQDADEHTERGQPEIKEVMRSHILRLADLPAETKRFCNRDAKR